VLRVAEVSFHGLTPAARDLLQSKSISAKAVAILVRMKPSRQTEAARLMVAAACYSAPYARALISATERSLVISSRAGAKVLMEPRRRRAAGREIVDLAGKLHDLSGFSGSDLITLQVARLYFVRLLQNKRVSRYLQKKWPQVFSNLEELILTPM